MKDVTISQALSMVGQANEMTREQITDLQKNRLDDLVAHARVHSAFYKEKYADLPESPCLKELPVVTKQELTPCMNDWICDPHFNESELTRYLSDIDNLGGPFMGKYSVSTTSGTTGEPLRMLRDTRHVNINGALLQNRLYDGPMLKNLPEIAEKNVRLASVLATGGYHAAYTAFEKRKKALAEEGIENTMLLLSIGEPIKEMVRRLNEFQPDVITGYPSFLHVLSGEQNKGALNITPKAILCSAEQLTDETRMLIEDRFSCPVGNVFCSTEAGEVALLCQQGRMHLNSDWIIVEPVDKAGNPVPAGEMSHAILVTNLANAVQPIIRYRVDDCVIMHEKKCPCGQPFPFMDILGRTDDIPEFQSAEGCVRLSSIVFLNAVTDIPGIAIYQFIQPDKTSLIMRVQYLDGADPDLVNKEITCAVKEQLAAHALENIGFDIHKAPPKRAEKGKKMRSYVKMC